MERGAERSLKDDPGSSLFAIRKGTAKMTVPSADGHEVVVNLVTEGDIFGEIALLDGRPRAADAVAISDGEMFVIERRDFLPLVREEPEMAIKLIEILRERLRQTTQQVEGVIFLHLPGRLARPCYACPVVVAYWHVAGEHQPTIAPLGREQMDPS
jgi:CRP/FNR family transcriptional regulator, cyclic AMP receptor protein